MDALTNVKNVIGLFEGLTPTHRRLVSELMSEAVRTERTAPARRALGRTRRKRKNNAAQNGTQQSGSASTAFTKRGRRKRSAPEPAEQ